jgi:hypothetical protein
MTKAFDIIERDAKSAPKNPQKQPKQPTNEHLTARTQLVKRLKCPPSRNVNF